MKILFDFDGTISLAESLPIIAAATDKQTRVAKLTANASVGIGDYETNLRTRIALLAQVPVDHAAEAVLRIPLRTSLVDFIRHHSDLCVVVTSNIDCWVAPTLDKLGCDYFCSKATVQGNRIVRLDSILDKAEIVRRFVLEGHKVVYVGDGANDYEAMVDANISIAMLASKNSCPELTDVADFVSDDEDILVLLLRYIIKTYPENFQS